jgi:hypothetical protein
MVTLLTLFILPTHYASMEQALERRRARFHPGRFGSESA